MAIEDASLVSALSAGLPEEAGERERLLKEMRRRAEERASADIREALVFQANANNEDITELGRAFGESAIEDWEIKPTKEMADQIRSTTGADALVRFRITDYGRTPRSWRNGVIAFEVVSTLGIAAVAYSYPKTRALAGVYLLQETIEESAEAFAGFWALDEVCRPIRMQAQLYDLHTGLAVWEGSATGLSDIRLSRLVRTIATTERESQLQNASVSAARKLARELVDAIPNKAPVELPRANPTQ